MLTLNLLPTNEKESLHWIKIHHLIIFYSQLVFAALLVLVVLLLTILFFLKIQVSAIERAILLGEGSPVEAVIRETKEEIADINTKLQIIDQVQAQQKFSTVILGDLAKFLPAGIQVINFSYEGENHQAIIDGRASTRNDFILLKSLLEKYQRFSDIDSPFSNLIKPSENNFRVKFTIK